MTEADFEREHSSLVANVKMWWNSFEEAERFEVELKCLEHNLPLIPTLSLAFMGKVEPKDIFRAQANKSE